MVTGFLVTVSITLRIRACGSMRNRILTSDCWRYYVGRMCRALLALLVVCAGLHADECGGFWARAVKSHPTNLA
jgi:hypothetical protein